MFTPLIEKRDEYMALKLQSELKAHDYRKILAVVGAGHLPGISKRLAAPVPDMEEIEARLAELSVEDIARAGLRHSSPVVIHAIIYRNCP